MNKEFLIERQGKTFVMYAGLLDLAHERGLHSIETELLQIPTADNKFVAIAKATIVVLCAENGLCTFTGIGDAAPDNVTPAMRTCLIRMAETRAKARALRDATNIGVSAFEELAEEDNAPGKPPSATSQAKPPATAPKTNPTTTNTGGNSGTELAWLSRLQRLKIEHKPVPFMRFVLSEEHAERSDVNFARAMKTPDKKLLEFAANLGEPT